MKAKELCDNWKVKFTAGLHPEVYITGGKKDYLIAQMLGDDVDEMDSRARLMASAPALLAALEKVTEIVEDGGCESEDMDAAVKQARAAIQACREGK